MMKKDTLYEVLEVSENASQEVIEKAYKVLVKRYHPDLQQESEKKKAEEKIKKINEAYDILGNDEKRKEYDEALKAEREQEAYKYNNVHENEFYQNNVVRNNETIDRENEAYEREKLEKKLQREEIRQRKKMQENLNKEYEIAYNNYLKSLGYKVKNKWSKENLIDFLIVIGIIIVVLVALWFIPPTHDWMINFYEKNPIIKTIIDVIIAVVTGIFKGIWNFIVGLFN